MLVLKVFTTVFFSAQCGATYSYCDTHVWDPSCRFDDIARLPDNVDHEVLEGYEIKTTGSPIPKMSSLAPIPKSSSNVRNLE